MLESCKVGKFINFNIRKNSGSCPFSGRYKAHGCSGFQDGHPERTNYKHFTNESHEYTARLPSLNLITFQLYNLTTISKATFTNIRPYCICYQLTLNNTCILALISLFIIKP
jgi:hypothetical protein